MKLKTYQLCLWCDAALHGCRKWFWLAGNVLLLLLAIPLRLMWLLLPALLLANAVLALYLLHQHHAFGAVYHRKPRPVDAMCETILIDAALIGHGIRLRAAAQPIDVGDGLSMDLGESALVLGGAMALTADELPQADRAAILSAVNALNINTSQMRNHNPVLSRRQEQGVTIVTVREGRSNRHYYMGEPDAVAKLCPTIREGYDRELTAHDRLRIADTARYIAQGNCRVLAWATALDSEKPAFLGMAGLGEELLLNSLKDTADLRAMGLTIMLNKGHQSDAELDSLRALMQLPEHHARADIHLTQKTEKAAFPLGVFREPGDSLIEPVAALRQRFFTIENTLRRFAMMLLLPMLVALLSGSAFTPVCIAGMLTAAAILIGVDLNAPKLRWPTLITACLLALTARLLLSTQTAPLIAMASGMIAVTAAACTVIRLGGEGFRFSVRLRNPAFWLMAAAAILLAGLLVYGGLQGLAVLLPLGFALLISAAVILLVMFEHKNLK